MTMAAWQTRWQCPAGGSPRRAQRAGVAEAGVLLAALLGVCGSFGVQMAAADDGLQLRYAMARLKLAELDLQRAVKLNRPTPNAIGGLEITRLTNHVRLMQRQLEIAQGKPQSSARELGLAVAELAAETARADLDAARAANKRSPRAVKEINIQRLETMVEIAELRLELYRNPSYVPSPIDEMQWHIDQLTEQLIDLRHRLETRSTNGFGNNE